MTVVVLIFLVSLVVIMMRNTELVAQLSDSVSQNETISNQRSDFELRIASMGDELFSCERYSIKLIPKEKALSKMLSRSR